MTPTGPTRPLDSYPRPNVAVDTAVLTFDAGALRVVLTGTHGDRRLPGTFLRPGERLRDAVARSLAEKAGVLGLEPEQLRVFDDPERDDRGWVLSVAHFAVVPSVRLDPAKAELVPVGELRPMPYGHSEIVRLAVQRLRDEYWAAPDPRNLIGPTFTLRDLQRLHEAVAGEELRRESFRKRMAKHVVSTGELLRGVGIVGKPPQLYRKVGPND